MAIEQNSYRIDIIALTGNSSISFTSNQIIKYEVLKDSRLRNFNIHMLTLARINVSLYNVLETSDVRIALKLSLNSKVIKTQKFKIESINTIDEIDNVFNIQLIMISDYIYSLKKSSKYANLTASDDSTELSTAYQFLTKIISNMSIDGGTKISSNYNNAGEIKFLYEHLTVPKSLNDIELFDYLIEQYPPYYIKPYFIIDDFYFDERESVEIKIILNNIIDTNGNYKLVNVKKLASWQTSKLKFLYSEKLFDFTEFKKLIRATIFLRNTNSKKIFRLQPENNKSNETINEESNLDIKHYKKKMYFKKLLSKYESSIDSYTFYNADINDYSFTNVYNMSNIKKFDMLPISIYYKFEKNSGSDNLYMTTNVDFVRSPSNLLTS